MKPLARVAAEIPPQGVRVIMELAWKIPDAIHLEVGEPNFPTPAHIVEAAALAVRDDRWHHYTPNAGIWSLREAIAEKMRSRNGLEVTPEQVVVHAGAVEGIASVLLALAEAGDEVLIPGLTWPNYEMFLRLQGATPVPYPLREANGFLPDPDEIARLVTPRTKALFTNTPGNPTGTVFPAELLRALVDLCRRYDLYLVSDEVYEDIVFDAPHVSAARFDTDGRVITLSGFSKGYAMTGWRIGYTVSPPRIAEVITKIQEPLISCTNAVAQKAAEAALRGPQDVVEAMRQAYRRRRDMALDILRREGLYRYTPQGAFYLLVDVRGAGEDSYAVARALLREEKVAVAPGEAFGAQGRGLVRVSLASSEEAIREGLTRLARFVRRPLPAPAAGD